MLASLCHGTYLKNASKIFIYQSPMLYWLSVRAKSCDTGEKPCWSTHSSSLSYLFTVDNTCPSWTLKANIPCMFLPCVRVEEMSTLQWNSNFPCHSLKWQWKVTVIVLSKRKQRVLDSFLKMKQITSTNWCVIWIRKKYGSRMVTPINSSPGWSQKWRHIFLHAHSNSWKIIIFWWF